MNAPTQGDLLRDAGIDSVKANNPDFISDALVLVERMEPGALMTGEDIRAKVEQVTTPKHPNAWGALIRTLVTKGILKPTGHYRKMQRPTSHSRRNPVYRR